MTLSAADIKFFQSELEGSSGGAMSTLEIPKNQLCLIFGDVSRSAARYGGVEYRKVFAVNTHPTGELYSGRLWLLMQPIDGVDMAIGIGTLDDTDPDPIPFVSPTDKSQAIYLGDLVPGSVTPIWLRRVVSPETPEFDRGFFQLALTGNALQGA